MLYHKERMRRRHRGLCSSSVPQSNRCQVDVILLHSSADKSLARPGRKQATATEDFDVHISYL